MKSLKWAKIMKKIPIQLSIMILAVIIIFVAWFLNYQYFGGKEKMVKELESDFEKLIEDCEKIEKGSLATYCILSVCEAVKPVEEKIQRCLTRNYTEEKGYYGPEASKYIGYHDSDDCIESIVPKTLAVCDALSPGDGLSPKNICYRDLAKKEKDESICEKVDDLSLRIDCFEKLAIAKKDPEICNKISYSYFEKWCLANPEADLCGYGLSHYKEDTTRHYQDKNYCVALAGTDVSKCASLGDGAVSCYSSFALENNDLSLCDKILNISKAFAKEQRDGCYVALAELRKDPSLCEDINNDYGTKDRCYLRSKEDIDGSFCETGDVAGYLHGHVCYPYIAEQTKDISLCAKAGQDIFTCFNNILTIMKEDLTKDQEIYDKYCQQRDLFDYVNSGDFLLEAVYGGRKEIEEEKNFDLITYRDEGFAFEVDYPSTWQIHPSLTDQFLEVEEFAFYFFPRGDQQGQNSIHIGIKRNSDYLSLEDFYKEEEKKFDNLFAEHGQERSYIYSNYFFKEKKPTSMNVGGEQAFRFENMVLIPKYKDMLPKYTFVVVSKDEFVFEISVPEEVRSATVPYSKEEFMEIFNNMLSSFRFIEVSKECKYKKGEYEMRVYDSEGRVTGKVNGEIKREIPDSFYHEAYGSFPASINIFDPKGEYTNEFFGIKNGTYMFNQGKTVEGKETSFDAYYVPLYAGQTHQIVIDWKALARGEEGVLISVDLDKDGRFENTIKSGPKLTCEEFLKKIKNN